MAATTRCMVRFACVLFGGLIVGLVVTVIVGLAVALLAYCTGEAVQIPGMLQVWVTRENGLPAVNFIPYGAGLRALTLVVAVGVVFADARRQTRRLLAA
ncbi:hypothetical protein [Actinomyces sp.]|uniref:hypothetical protein n=1 Tax=Actinomyces sp. TaxID=29317 RepID=UPI0026DBB434|nr:hypothetical protein [Actinomyces sp.]MDO4900140.1 hypothetical protein [Actinomyces sp.]